MAKAYSKKELAALYNVDGGTLRKWIERIPGFVNTKLQIYTPKEVERIFEHLGKPDNAEEEKV